ncbi:MAG: hypothetical protein ACFHWZ_13480 [Phycisphaerales bacterium]
MHQEHEAPPLLAERKHEVLADKVLGEQRSVNLRRDRLVIYVEIIDAELHRERLGDRLLGAHSGFDENLTDAFARALGHRDGCFELLGRDGPVFDEDLSEFLSHFGHNLSQVSCHDESDPQIARNGSRTKH